MTPNRISKKDLEEMLQVEFDYDARTAFLRMTREEQLMALLSAQAYLRGEIAKIKKWQVDYQEDAIRYRQGREKAEKASNGHGDEKDLKTTTQTIIAEVKRQMDSRFFDWGVWLRDKVLPQFVSTFIIIIIILMGLFFSGKFP